MTPSEVGLDGAEGIVLDKSGQAYRMLRGTHDELSKYLDDLRERRRNQFWWVTDLNLLLYCNSEGELFEVNFTPFNL
jgi:hypothetical protein